MNKLSLISKATALLLMFILLLPGCSSDDDSNNAMFGDDIITFDVDGNRFESDRVDAIFTVNNSNLKSFGMVANALDPMNSPSEAFVLAFTSGPEFSPERNRVYNSSENCLDAGQNHINSIPCMVMSYDDISGTGIEFEGSSEDMETMITVEFNQDVDYMPGGFVEGVFSGELEDSNTGQRVLITNGIFRVRISE